MVPAATTSMILATHAIGNAILLYYMFHPLLEHDSIVMAHMDPSIIIETEIPLKQIAYYVGLSCLLSIILLWGCQWAISTQTRNERQEQSLSHNYYYHLSSLMNNIRLIASATIFLHCSFLLCGINYRVVPMHTFLSSLYVVTNAILPIITLSVPSSSSSSVALTAGVADASLLQQQQHGDQQSRGVNYKAMGVYLFGPLSSSSSDGKKQSIHSKQQQQQHQDSIDRNLIQRRIHQLSTLGTIIGMCICAIFRVLDHGMQIQRYPMPIIVGATVGRVGGVFVGSILLMMMTLPSSSYRH